MNCQVGVCAPCAGGGTRRRHAVRPTITSLSPAKCNETGKGGESEAVERAPVALSCRRGRNPPLGRDKLLYQYGDKTPGVLGLKNHGNTCFMNAVVQCLSNTDLLAEYLGLERYKSAETRVANGEVTEHLASLVRALWTLEYTPQLSVDFKAIVSKFGSQFRGNSQHDALEFLLWLLDRVHEDINLASHNNNNTTKACERQQHSFVQEHFQAQYKSSLTCPHCLKQSNTFDPFLCISLPIPLRQTRPVCVTLVFSTKGQRYLRVGLAVPLFGSVACLRRMVADEGNVSPDQVILTEVYASGFQRSFFDEDDLTSIAENDVIYAFQAPPLYIRGGSARTSGSLQRARFHVNFTRFLSRFCRRFRFGPPFLMREDRSISWDQLQQSILSKLYYLMINGAPAQNNRVLFNIRVVGGSSFYSYLSPQDGRPLYHPAVDRSVALKLCSPGGPPHVKLIIEWEYRIKDCLFGNIQEEVVKDADSVRNQQQQHVQQYSCTLDECFQLYTKEEQLAPDDAWKCPHCKQLQQGMVKMSLWTLPDILILHLKRFRQVGERRNKLTTFVRFPLVDLDMTPHVVNRNHGPPQAPLQPGWKQPSRPELAPTDFLYDLYAVCNHHGGMHGAFCRNSVDAQWYSYDDSNAEAVPEGDVCTRGAYILFYQRRKTIPPWSASSSLANNVLGHHASIWFLFIPTGEFESKPFVRGTHARSVSMRSPTKARESFGKVLPLRWSFRTKDRMKHSVETQSGELVEYLESGRRPRCTKEPIVALVATPPQAHAQRGAFEGGQECSSPSGSSLSCAESCYSPKIPEGQSRPAMERHLSSTVKGSEDGSLRVRSSNKRARQEPGRTLDIQLQRVAMLGAHISSHSAPPSRDSTLRKNKVPFGGSTRSPRDPFQAEGQRGREGQSQENLVAFVKPGFMRKDAPRSPPMGREGRVNGYGHLGKPASGDFTKLSQSNGTLSAVTKHERQAYALPCRQVRLRNGHVACPDCVDIKRAHSSSNIQTKLDVSFHGCASLQRNGDVAASRRVPLSDKPGFATLQRTQFSTTSLGKRGAFPCALDVCQSRLGDVVNTGKKTFFFAILHSTTALYCNQ
uniref:ubiquitinyl hydrolase 1 n=1 Tax=Hippocampus comes TaxID=109280 RepID=A0A3Q2YSG7_HIPCM